MFAIVDKKYSDTVTWAPRPAKHKPVVLLGMKKAWAPFYFVSSWGQTYSIINYS